MCHRNLLFPDDLPIILLLCLMIYLPLAAFTPYQFANLLVCLIYLLFPGDLLTRFTYFTGLHHFILTIGTLEPWIPHMFPIPSRFGTTASPPAPENPI